MAIQAVRLHVRESGPADKPAVLFLHGSPLSGRMWQPQLERLPEFHCLAPDLPGHGRSAWTPAPMSALVAALADLIRDRTPSGRAHVVGLSYGGVVAQAMLAQAPEVVDHVILSGTAARASAALLAVLRLQLALNRPLIERLPPAVLARLVAWQFGLPDAYRAMLGEDIKAVSAEVLTRTLLASYGAIATPADFARPILVVVGARENAVAQHMARRLCRELPGARGVVAPGVGHVWNLQAPDLFAATVRAWVNGAVLPAELRSLED